VPTSPPKELLEYFDASSAMPEFYIRRRSALVTSAPYGQVLALCVIQAISTDALPERKSQSRHYRDVTLLEDWLSKEEALAFLTNVHNGEIRMADLPIIRGAAAQWQIQAVPLKNMFMRSPGLVAYCPMDPRRIEYSQQPLISASEPFYPDHAEAVREWIGLEAYNGQSDTRNGSVIFLMPQQRAYFTRAVSNGNQLSFEIAGREAHQRSYLVKGAYWTGEILHHFECEIVDGHGIAPVPDHPDRLEYVLLDDKSELYDFQQERAGHHTGIEREHVAAVDASASAAIQDTIRFGEGQLVEFKPFVDPQDQLGPVNNRTKLGQIIQTTVAFSNADGGRVFIGVDDACGLAGIESSLRAWGKHPDLEELCRRWSGALINKIRGAIRGEVPLSITFARAADQLIAIVEVPEARAKPIEFVGDSYYYVRSGASNRRLSPSEWAVAAG
jgi:hypothetical protein